MSTARVAKETTVAEIKEKLKKATSFVILEYKGISVAEVTELRNEYRTANVEYKVYKNRLLKIALNDLGFTQFDDALNGANAIAIATTDEISASAKIAIDKQKAFKKMTIKCGCVEGSYIDENGVKALASMPSKEGLLSQVLGLLQAPIAGFARVLNAISEQKAN